MLLLDSCFSLDEDWRSPLEAGMTDEEDSSFGAELLLDMLVSLELDCGEMVEEDDSSSFGTTLLLDKSFSLELDSAPDDEFSEEEYLSLTAELLLDFKLLLDSGSEPEITEDEDSSSSFGKTLLLSSSPHAASVSVKGNKKAARDCHHHALLVAGFALRLIAMTFRIRTPSPQRPVI